MIYIKDTLMSKIKACLFLCDQEVNVFCMKISVEKFFSTIKV